MNIGQFFSKVYSLILIVSTVRNHVSDDLKNAGTESDFENELFSEIMKSERLRAFILGSVAAAGALAGLSVFLFFSSVFPPESVKLISGLPFVMWLVIGFTVLAFYETAIYLALGYLIKIDKKWPRPFRIMNTLFETSIPTFALLLGGKAFGYQMVHSPVVYFYFIFILLSALRLNFALSFFSGAVAGIGYISAALYLDSGKSVSPEGMMLHSSGLNFIRGIILIGSGAVMGLVALRIRRSIVKTYRYLHEKNRIVGIFGQHVSPVVVNRLLEGNANLSEMRNVCVLFLDIRNFTRFSEGKDPGEIVDFLNYLFDFMIEIINSHNGIINKFLGDGFMAVFGAPVSDKDDSINAISAGLEIISRVKSESEKGNIPATGIGIGIHRGMAMTGSIGSPQRREYTVIGDVVNIASRIESLNKIYNSRLLVSMEVLQSAEFSGSEDLGQVEIRGHRESVRLFKLA